MSNGAAAPVREVGVWAAVSAPLVVPLAFLPWPWLSSWLDLFPIGFRVVGRARTCAGTRSPARVLVRVSLSLCLSLSFALSFVRECVCVCVCVYVCLCMSVSVFANAFVFVSACL